MYCFDISDLSLMKLDDLIWTNLPLSMGIQILGPLLRAIPSLETWSDPLCLLYPGHSNWALTYRPRSLFTSPVCDSHEFKMQPGGGLCPVWGTQNFLFAVCRWYGSVRFIRLWPACILGWIAAGMTVSKLWGHGSLLENNGFILWVGTEILHQMKEFNYLWVL